jgi:peroxiredoxin
LILAPSALLAEEEAPLLKPQLEEKSAAFAKQAPEAMRQTFQQGIDQVRQTGILDKAAKVGDKAPDGVLLDSDGEKLKASSLWAEGPVVLTFYRGGWCPYCNLQLKNLQDSVAALQGAGARVVAVTPELPEKATDTVASNKLALQVLSDRHNQYAKALGIAFKLPESILPIYRDRLRLADYNGDEQYELPLAATYVIDQQDVIRYAFLDADYKKRAEPRDVVKALKKMAQGN